MIEHDICDHTRGQLSLIPFAATDTAVNFLCFKFHVCFYAAHEPALTATKHIGDPWRVVCCKCCSECVVSAATGRCTHLSAFKLPLIKLSKLLRNALPMLLLLPMSPSMDFTKSDCVPSRASATLGSSLSQFFSAQSSHLYQTSFA